ncbi:Phosphatidylinositol 4-phosphate 5-kinase 7 [Babesia sp. Xinjiang]|uniref:Phosphatidylinositol 4-phosphate 5-kinase 7 n=1 Tax=Babesia sp. Xinjiang TaxID=462227 RepID=UPI000A23BE0B|nr:Phosphatidylinositol 4-phosphate 5-kinase 7 [Babesia sp. Xinjiang]ORM39743.1 Phosphatidylinositol 4-phosphate 5-kinase 7 [Babesia sp. Xinjiang]
MLEPDFFDFEPSYTAKPAISKTTSLSDDTAEDEELDEHTTFTENTWEPLSINLALPDDSVYYDTEEPLPGDVVPEIDFSDPAMTEEWAEPMALYVTELHGPPIVGAAIVRCEDSQVSVDFSHPRYLRYCQHKPDVSKLRTNDINNWTSRGKNAIYQLQSCFYLVPRLALGAMKETSLVDFVYFTLPTPSGNYLYGISYVARFESVKPEPELPEENKVAETDDTQKTNGEGNTEVKENVCNLNNVQPEQRKRPSYYYVAVCVISKVPFFCYIGSRLECIAQTYFHNQCFSDHQLLLSFVEHMNSVETVENWSYESIYFNLEWYFKPIALCLSYRSTLFIIKCILLGRRIAVYSHSAARTSTAILSLLTMIPGANTLGFNSKNFGSLWHSWKKFSMPLFLFHSKNLILPYFTADMVDLLKEAEGYLIGITDFAMVKTLCKIPEFVVNLEMNNIQLMNGELLDMYHPSLYEVQQFDRIMEPDYSSDDEEVMKSVMDTSEAIYGTISSYLAKTPATLIDIGSSVKRVLGRRSNVQAVIKCNESALGLLDKYFPGSVPLWLKKTARPRDFANPGDKNSKANMNSPRQAQVPVEPKLLTIQDMFLKMSADNRTYQYMGYIEHLHISQKDKDRNREIEHAINTRINPMQEYWLKFLTDVAYVCGERRLMYQLVMDFEYKCEAMADCSYPVKGTVIKRGDKYLRGNLPEPEEGDPGLLDLLLNDSCCGFTSDSSNGHESSDSDSDASADETTQDVTCEDKDTTKDDVDAKEDEQTESSKVAVTKVQKSKKPATPPKPKKKVKEVKSHPLVKILSFFQRGKSEKKSKKRKVREKVPKEPKKSKKSEKKASEEPEDTKEVEDEQDIDEAYSDGYRSATVDASDEDNDVEYADDNQYDTYEYEDASYEVEEEEEEQEEEEEEEEEEEAEQDYYAESEEVTEEEYEYEEQYEYEQTRYASSEAEYEPEQDSYVQESEPKSEENYEPEQTSYVSEDEIQHESEYEKGSYASDDEIDVEPEQPSYDYENEGESQSYAYPGRESPTSSVSQSEAEEEEEAQYDHVSHSPPAQQSDVEADPYIGQERDQREAYASDNEMGYKSDEGYERASREGSDEERYEPEANVHWDDENERPSRYTVDGEADDQDYSEQLQEGHQEISQETQDDYQPTAGDVREEEQKSSEEVKDEYQQTVVEQKEVEQQGENVEEFEDALDDSGEPQAEESSQVVTEEPAPESITVERSTPVGTDDQYVGKDDAQVSHDREEQHDITEAQVEEDIKTQDETTTVSDETTKQQVEPDSPEVEATESQDTPVEGKTVVHETDVVESTSLDKKEPRSDEAEETSTKEPQSEFMGAVEPEPDTQPSKTEGVDEVPVTVEKQDTQEKEVTASDTVVREETPGDAEKPQVAPEVTAKSPGEAKIHDDASAYNSAEEGSDVEMADKQAGPSKPTDMLRSADGTTQAGDTDTKKQTEEGGMVTSSVKKSDEVDQTGVGAAGGIQDEDAAIKAQEGIKGHGIGEGEQPKEGQIGPDGHPIKPGEGEIGPDGHPIKPGEGEIGPDGKPIKPGEGEIGPDGKPIKPGEGEIGPDGKPIKPKEGEEGEDKDGKAKRRRKKPKGRLRTIRINTRQPGDEVLSFEVTGTVATKIMELQNNHSLDFLEFWINTLCAQKFFEGHQLDTFSDPVYYTSGNIAKQKYPNGDLYIGELVCMRREGRGTYIAADGTVYEGSWLGGKRHGQGTLKSTKHGYKYRGSWVADKREGHGELHTPHFIYVGGFKNNTFNGTGKLINGGKDTYEGDFQDGKYNGRGRLTMKDGTVKIGSFRNNELYGVCSMIKPDGRIYVGKFHGDVLDGRGKLVYDSTTTFDGQWMRGIRDGQGVLSIKMGNSESDGTIAIDGIWELDSLVLGEVLLTFPNGYKYFGSIAFCSDLTPLMHTPSYNESIYSLIKELFLSFDNRWLPHGKGIIKYPSGSSFNGDMFNGMRHGEGIMVFPNGVSYSGPWAFGTVHGDAEVTFPGDLLGTSLKFQYGKLIDTLSEEHLPYMNECLIEIGAPGFEREFTLRNLEPLPGLLIRGGMFR